MDDVTVFVMVRLVVQWQQNENKATTDREEHTENNTHDGCDEFISASYKPLPMRTVS
jgi:hypothetical protein